MSTNRLLINEMELYAKENKVPIMIKDTIEYILNIIKNNNISNVLEIGTAIGYSTIIMASNVYNVTSIERDKLRYDIAVSNVSKSNLRNINLVFGDALEIEITDKYDLIIIDAAKSQNIKFFEKYKNNLNNNGIIVIDNMNFHGLVGKSNTIESKNLRSLVKKLEFFWVYIDSQKDFTVEHIDIGDGIVVCKIKNI